MPRVPDHLCERALVMLQGGMRTADVARAINCNEHTVRCLRQSYRETGRTADHPRSGRTRATTPAQYRYIWTSHLRDRYSMATTTPRVTPGTHNPSISAQTVGNRLREAEMRACRPFGRWWSPDQTELEKSALHWPVAVLSHQQCHQPYCLFCSWFPARQECQCSAMASEEPGSQSHWACLRPVGSEGEG